MSMVCFEKLNESWIPKKIRIDHNQGTPTSYGCNQQRTANARVSIVIITMIAYVGKDKGAGTRHTKSIRAAKSHPTCYLLPCAQKDNVNYLYSVKAVDL
eukprot:scaffold68763_cov59-Attheya_sp.AAC.4